MILQFLKKEFLENISGPKFLITFAISSVLILTSIFAGYEIYQAEMKWYSQAKNENIRGLEHSGGYASLLDNGSKTLRVPSKLGVFVRGVDSVIGKAANVSEDPSIILRDSRFGLNPIFAVFGELDLAFIVRLILSLFALLFSYNTISGERELGTLKQVMSYPVSRSSFIIGKSLGGLINLLVTLYIPLLIGLLFLSLSTTFSPEEWLRILLIVLTFSLYLAVFYMVGVLMSALTRNSFVSFLLGLFVWVVSIIIIPKGAVELAGQINPAPSIDHIEAERLALESQAHSDFKNLAEEYYKELNMTPATFDHRKLREMMDRAEQEANDAKREKEFPLLREYDRKQRKLISTAEAFSRVSPSSSMTLSVSRLANTDARYRERLITALQQYQQEYLDYAKDMVKKNPDKEGGGIQIGISPDGLTINVPSFEIDVSGLPDFMDVDDSTDQMISDITLDLLILTIYPILIFAGAFLAFTRYDVR